jgi:hypothetical protein
MIRAAIRILGYAPAHMTERLQGLWRDLARWKDKEGQVSSEAEAIEARIESAQAASRSTGSLEAALAQKLASLRNLRDEIEQIREQMHTGG